MTLAVARAAAAAETTASRHRRVRTSQFACGPRRTPPPAPASRPPRCLAGTVRADQAGRAPSGRVPGRRGRYRGFVRQQRGGGACAPRRVGLRSGVRPRAVVISGARFRPACSCGPSLVRRKKSAATRMATTSTRTARTISPCISAHTPRVNGRLRRRNAGTPPSCSYLGYKERPGMPRDTLAGSGQSICRILHLPGEFVTRLALTYTPDARPNAIAAYSTSWTPLCCRLHGGNTASQVRHQRQAPVSPVSYSSAIHRQLSCVPS